MVNKIRAMLIAGISLVAVTAVTSSASALLTGISTPGGTFTATTTALQTLRTTSGIFFDFGLTCLQRLVVDVTAGLYSASPALQVIGNVSDAIFICNDGARAVALDNDTRRTGNANWPIDATVSAANVILAGPTVLVTALNVHFQITEGSTAQSCLFTGGIGFSFRSGRTIASLLGAQLSRVSGICTSDLFASTASYAVAPAPAIAALL